VGAVSGKALKNQAYAGEQNGLKSSCAADALQIRSVSQQRLENKPGVLSSVQLAKIVQAVMIVLQR
jgi:mRNA-degrading endonuclease toxin of MazEF toxin-antitoxin module